jgi:hypothetical protein
VRPGQHVNAGEVLLAVAPKGSAQVSLVSMVPADYRPMLKVGLKMRFELDGFRYEYHLVTGAETIRTIRGVGYLVAKA